MSLQLVTGNVCELPIGNVRDLGGMLRLLADDIDAGEYGAVTSLLTLVVRPDGIAIHTYGEDCSHYEMMGLFEAAKLRVFADDLTDE